MSWVGVGVITLLHVARMVDATLIYEDVIDDDVDYDDDND